MNENVDKHTELFTDKLLKDSSLESPSINFTSQIMSQVEAIAQSDVTTYKPLISKRVWIGVAVAIVGVLIYSFFGSASESEWLKSVDLSVLGNNKITNALSEFSFSKTILYAAAMFALMFAIQVTVLKGYFDRRLSV